MSEAVVYSKTIKLELAVKLDSNEPLAGVDEVWLCSELKLRANMAELGFRGIFAITTAISVPKMREDPLTRIEAKLDSLLKRSASED